VRDVDANLTSGDETSRWWTESSRGRPRNPRSSSLAALAALDGCRFLGRGTTGPLPSVSRRRWRDPSPHTPRRDVDARWCDGGRSAPSGLAGRRATGDAQAGGLVVRRMRIGGSPSRRGHRASDSGDHGPWASRGVCPLRLHPRSRRRPSAGRQLQKSPRTPGRKPAAAPTHVGREKNQGALGPVVRSGGQRLQPLVRHEGLVRVAG
jgi:hypothetical protein